MVSPDAPRREMDPTGSYGRAVRMGVPAAHQQIYPYPGCRLPPGSGARYICRTSQHLLPCTTRSNEGMGFDGFCSASEWYRVGYCKLTRGTSIKNTPLRLEGLPFVRCSRHPLVLQLELYDRSSRPRRLSPHHRCQLRSLNSRLLG